MRLITSLSVLILAISSISSVAQVVAYTSTAVITGHGDILPDGRPVRFIRMIEGVGDYVATDTIENGRFRLEVPVGEGLTVGSIVIDYHAFPTLIRKLYLTPGATVEMDAKDRYMSSWPVRSNVPEQAEYELYLESVKDYWTKRQELNIDLNKFKISSKIYGEKSDSLGRLMEVRYLDLLRIRPVGRVWMDMALSLAHYSKNNNTQEYLKALYASLDDSVKESPEGKDLYGYLYSGSHIGVGDRFPDVEFQDLDGNVHRLSEFQGKWCLVDFWNAGCGPCIRALPELRELKEKYPENLEIISMSLDTEDYWRKISEKLPLIGNNWNEGKKDYGIYRRIGTRTTPTYLLVSPDVIIKDIWTGYDTGELKQKMNFLSEK